MRQFLRRIKLLDSLQLELPVEKKRFVENLKSIVEEGSTTFYSSFGDLFIKGKKHYRGRVDYDGFKIKKKASMFENNMTMAVAHGTYYSSDGGLIIKAEINGFGRTMIGFYIMIVLFYLMFFAIMVSVPQDNSGIGWVTFPFLIIHASFMLGIPYFIMKRGVKRMKYDLERELFFLTQESFRNNH